MKDYLEEEVKDVKNHPWRWVGLIAVVGLLVWLSACSTKDEEEDPFLAEVERDVKQEIHTKN